MLSNAVSAFKAPITHNDTTNSPRRPGSSRGRSNSRGRQKNEGDDLAPGILPDVDHFSKNLELKQTLQEQKAHLFTMEFELGEKIKIIEQLKKSLQEAQSKEVELHKKA